MSRNSVDYTQYYNSYLNRLENKVKEEVGNALRNAQSELFSDVNERVKKMFNDVIDDFYGDYTPLYYNRNESLYNLIQSRIEPDCLDIWFAPEKMTPYRNGYSGEDGLYDQVFRKGWHGGAADGKNHPSPGTPLWRTPEKSYTFWGRSAVISDISPLDDFKMRLSDYCNSRMTADFVSLWEKQIRNIKINL